MEKLATKVTALLKAEEYKSVAKLKFAVLPHKAVALNAGLGFIGKNNLLITEQFGCAVLFGKVLTTAPFETMSKTPIESQCGDCTNCVDVCLSKSLQGTTWNVTKKREDMMVRKLCTLCLMCMIYCPYTERYAQ